MYPVKSMEETIKFYEERYASKYARPRAYAVCLKKDNFPIGYIKVDMEEHHDFGYGLRREFWHQGMLQKQGHHIHGVFLCVRTEKDSTNMSSHTEIYFVFIFRVSLFYNCMIDSCFCYVVSD